MATRQIVENHVHGKSRAAYRCLSAQNIGIMHDQIAPIFALSEVRAHCSSHPFLPDVQAGQPDNPRAARSTQVYIRKTPHRVSSIGALSAAEMPRPSTVCVSAGSMMPSSQSRAVLK